MPESRKVCLITGASSGIGEALAIEAARRGFQLSLAARSVDKLQAVAERCTALGTQVLVTACDVSSEADCRNFVQQTIAHFGRADVLINKIGRAHV